MIGGKFLNWIFNEAFDQLWDHRYKILLLYELTCHKVCLLYDFIFLIILHIRCKLVLDVALTVETRWVKDIDVANMAWWLKSAGALTFEL